MRNCFASCKAIQFYTLQCPFISFHQDLIKKTPVHDLENFPLWQQMWNLILSLYIPSSSRERTKEKEKNMPLCKKILVCFALCKLHIEVIAFFKSHMIFHDFKIYFPNFNCLLESISFHCLLSSTSWIIWPQCALDGTPATAGPGATGLVRPDWLFCHILSAQSFELHPNIKAYAWGC